MRKLLILLLTVFAFGISTYCQINLNYWMSQGRDKLVKQQFHAAIEDFNTIIRFKPDLDDAFYFRGIAKFFLGDYHGAIEDYSNAIVIKPYSSYLYTNYFLYRGIAREKLLDLKGALEDYTKAIDVNPGNWAAYINRGFVSIILKRTENAIEDFNMVILYERGNASAYLYRAIAYHQKGDQDQAMRDFTKAIQLDPTNPEGYIKRGSCYAEKKEFPKAIEDFNRAIKLDSTTSLAFFNRALAKLEVLDYNGAMKDFNKVIALDPQNDITYYNRAELKSRVGDFKGAIEDYTKVLAISPNNIFTYFNRAIMWQRINNNRKAIEDYTAAIKLYPQFASAYFNRSIAKQNLNDLAGAARDYEIAIKLNSSLQELKNTGKIDSTALAELERFNASFDPDNKLAASESNNGLAPIPNFAINYIPKNSPLKEFSAFDLRVSPHLNTRIKEMNVEPEAEGLFTLEYQDRTLPNDTIEHLFNKITALHNQKDSLLTLFSRAVLKKKLQDYNGAIEDYNTIIKVRPNFSQAYFNRANTRYDALQLLRSINEHNNTMSIDATSPTSVIKRKSSTPSFDQIMKDYQKCIELDPQFCYAYFNMANVQARQKEFTGAIINYTKAILLEPKFAEAYYNRGIVYLYIHEKEGGCSDLSKAGEYGIPKAYDAIRKFCNK